MYVAAVSGLACGLVLAVACYITGIAAMAVAGVFLIAARYSSSDYESSSDPEYDSESALLQVLRQI